MIISQEFFTSPPARGSENYYFTMLRPLRGRIHITTQPGMSLPLNPRLIDATPTGVERIVPVYRTSGAQKQSASPIVVAVSAARVTRTLADNFRAARSADSTSAWIVCSPTASPRKRKRAR